MEEENCEQGSVNFTLRTEGSCEETWRPVLHLGSHSGQTRRGKTPVETASATRASAETENPGSLVTGHSRLRGRDAPGGAGSHTTADPLRTCHVGSKPDGLLPGLLKAGTLLNVR